MKTRKIPLRKCIGCNEMKDKKELIRVVKTKDNVFFIDKTSKAAGRGAYVCANNQCLEKAFKNKGLERSFKMPIKKEIYEDLRRELEEN